MTSVHLRNVSKEYSGGTKALAEIELEVREGELLALVGASGSGKTTVLRLIAGLESPTRGSIHFGVDDVTAWPPWRRQTAMVSEASSLLPQQTAAENLAWSRERRRKELRSGTNGGRRPWWRTVWGALRRGSKRTEERGSERTEAQGDGADAELTDWAARLGLTDLLDRKPRSLSSGQQQRVALGRALLANPSVMLLDEPLGRLDGPQRSELSRELKRFQRRQGATWIYVTHDRREATSVADRIGLLDGGRLLQVGTPRELGDEPESLRVAQWMAARPLNVIHGRWRPSMSVAATWRASDGVLVRRVGAASPSASPSAGPAGGERAWWAGVVTELEEADGATWIWVSPEPAVYGEAVYGEAVPREIEHAGDLCVEVSATDSSWRRGDEVWAGFDRARARWFESNSGRRLR